MASTKGHAGLFALLGLSGITFAATVSSARKPRRSIVESGGKTGTTSTYSRVWESDKAGGSVPEWALPATFDVGARVMYRPPASTPVADTLPLDRSQVYSIVKRSFVAPILKGSEDAPQRDPAQPRKGYWIYELNVALDSGGENPTPYPAEVTATNLVAAPAASAVKQAAAVLAPTASAASTEPAAMQVFPLYPQGLVVEKGSVSGVVEGITKTSDGKYHYKLKAGFGPFKSEYTGEESQIRDTLAEKTGQQSYGYAFPEGVTLKAKNQSWQILKRIDLNGQKGYSTNQGDLSEAALILKLYAALK